MSHHPRRNQPALPYRPISPRRLIQECKRRLYRLGVRGPRGYELAAVLVELAPKVQSGVIYMGDVRMAERMGRCSKTAHRGKYDLLRAGLVRLSGAGPKMCPCAKCGGTAAGGRILNSHGQPVSAATGYELDPSLLSRPKLGPAPLAKGSNHETPAQRRLRLEQAERLREAGDRLRGRPGP